jgi:hypothetical protein
MADKQVKEMKILPTKVVKTATSKGNDMWNITFEIAGVEIEQNAVTFSETIANEAEKNIGEEVTSKIEVGEFNGRASYTLKEVNGVAGSGFKGGKGYQKDTVSIERQVAAKIAAESIVPDAKMTNQAWVTKFNHRAQAAYNWISTRSGEPAKVQEEEPLPEPDK